MQSARPCSRISSEFVQLSLHNASGIDGAPQDATPMPAYVPITYLTLTRIISEDSTTIFTTEGLPGVCASRTMTKKSTENSGILESKVSHKIKTSQFLTLNISSFPVTAAIAS